MRKDCSLLVLVVAVAKPVVVVSGAGGKAGVNAVTGSGLDKGRIGVDDVS